MKKCLVFLLIILVSINLTLAKNPENVTNVTLELELKDPGEVYIDGKKAVEGEYIDLEFPYIVSEQPIGIISPNNFKSIEYFRDSSDTFSVIQESSSFLVPHSSNGYQTIENREDKIKSQKFLKNIEPSFSHPLKSKALVKVLVQPEVKLNASRNLRENGKLVFRNQGGTLSIY